jgi:hypothetical protein
MALQVYDLESLLTDVETVLKNNLNTKLASIDTEKNDGITLRTVNSNAYHLQTMDQKNANFNPLILYGVDDNDAQPIGPANAHSYNISVVLVLADNGSDAAFNVIKRLLRYQRAIKEVFQDNWTILNKATRLKVSELAPDLNSSEEYKFVGVRLEATLV